MRNLLIVVLLPLTSCTLPVPKDPPLTAIEQCHQVLDGICSFYVRCTDRSNTAPLGAVARNLKQECEDFMAGRPPWSYNGHLVNLRRTCDQSTYVGSDVSLCSHALFSNSCEWPDVCENISIESR